MEEIETIAIGNVRCRFQYNIEYGDELNPNKVYFRVFSIPQNPMKWFTYTFILLDNNTAQGIMMTNNGYEEFAKKGIPERIIEIAATVLKRKIISSPTTPQDGNYLVGPSFKVWCRLVANNEKAKLNEAAGYFELDII